MIKIREIASIDELMVWREEVIANVFGEEPDDKLLAANRRYYESHAAGNGHIALVAACGGEDCGCGGACFSEELPSPENPSGKCAYLMNIYVRKEHRNRGIAHQIAKRLIEIAIERGCDKIFLETSAEGRRVYYSLGFREMPDMMIYGKEN
ncbi:MAG: GNAT family N-acetyltransferase [Clostridium sp.]|nr:GNAT family N-acetyltransferase [Clostridium sp.]